MSTVLKNIRMKKIVFEKVSLTSKKKSSEKKSVSKKKSFFKKNLVFSMFSGTRYITCMNFLPNFYQINMFSGHTIVFVINTVSYGPPTIVFVILYPMEKI